MRTQLTATYDPETCALYIRVMDLPAVRQVIRGEGHIMDIGADAHIVGHEFLLDEPMRFTGTSTLVEFPTFPDVPEDDGEGGGPVGF